MFELNRVHQHLKKYLFVYIHAMFPKYLQCIQSWSDYVGLSRKTQNWLVWILL